MHMGCGQCVCLLILVLVASSPSALAVQDTPTPIPICGGNWTTEIRSPGYPDPYPGGMECVWTITADEGRDIYLTFDQFQVDGEEDLVEIYDVDVPDHGTSMIGSFSGNQDRFMILSAGNILRVNFTSSNTSSAHRHRRFHATIKTDEKGCGGTFTSSKSGVISTPIYQRTLLPSHTLSCTWQIDANTNRKLALSFDDSSLDSIYGRPVFLEVRDGFGPDAPLLANFTKGKSMLPDVISTKDYVYVKLTFNLDSPPKVKATFVEISGECSGHILLTETKRSYKIQSPNFPKPYPNNLDCRWLVESAPETTTLVAIATEYQVPDVNDGLTVYDGASRSANQLWSYRGRIVHDEETPLLVSSGQSMWVKFTTDETENEGYFSLNINLQESGGLVRNQTDAYFPASQPMTVFQCYAPAGHQCVFFTTFWNCTFNETGAVISFYEGRMADPRKLIHRYSANYTEWESEYVPAFSNGQWMLIVAENLGQGGNCVGSQITLLDDDSFQHSYGTSGSRLQPPKDTLYNGWVIHPETAAGKLLQLSILKLDLIYEEFLTITEVVNGQIHEIMALKKEWNGALTVYITPVSPITVAYMNIPETAGRSLAYSMGYSMLEGCEAQLNATKPGYVTSPDFPSRYPLNAFCTWTIRIDRLLHISFQDIHLSGGHYIQIDYNQRGKSSVGMRLYGKTRPDDMIVVGASEFHITFDTTARFSHPSKGFKLFYEEIACGGNMTATSGKLKTPHYPADITKDITCMWVINLPDEGAKGMPNIVQLQYDSNLPLLQTETNYFEIRDGPNSDSALVAYQVGPNITEYRGDVLSIDNKVTVLSRTNQVFVSYVFEQNSLKNGFPFEVEYKLCACEKQCKNGLCLHEAWRCDGIDQCGDNTDELECLTPIPDCKGYQTHMVKSWIMGTTVAAAFIVGIIATLMSLFTIKRCRSRNRDEDGSLLIQED